MTVEELILKHEGLRLKPYKCPSGRTTIGIGRNLDDRGITEAEAHYLLKNDIEGFGKDLDFWYSNWRTLTPNRQAVLLDMCFNMGVHGLMGFKKTLDLISDERYEEAAKEMLNSKWAHQVGSRAVELSEMMKEG